MALIVEDGTGLPNAESYIDVAFLEAFCEDWALALPDDATQDLMEAALRRATMAFDSIYGPRFQGTPLSYSQALVFPMNDLVDRRSFVLPSLPKQVKQATAAIGWQETRSPMTFYPTVSPGKIKKSVKVDQVEVEYDVSGMTTLGAVGGTRPVMSLVEALLSGIVVLPPMGTRTYQGSAVRG